MEAPPPATPEAHYPTLHPPELVALRTVAMAVGADTIDGLGVTDGFASEIIRFPLCSVVVYQIRVLFISKVSSLITLSKVASHHRSKQGSDGLSTTD